MQSKIKQLKLLHRYFRPYYPNIIAGSIGLFSISILVLPKPFISKYIIDHLIPEKNTMLVLVCVLSILGVALFQNIVNYFISRLFSKINLEITQKIQDDMLKSILISKTSQKEQFHPGYLISRIKDDTLELKSIFIDRFIYISRNLFSIFAGLIGIFYLNFYLSLYVICIIPLFVFATIFLTKKFKVKLQIFYENRAQLTAQLDDSIKSYYLFKIFSKEQENLKRFSIQNSIATKSEIDKNQWSFFHIASIDSILELIPTVILGIGGYLIIEDKFTLGTLVAYTTLVTNVFGPIHGMTSINLNMQGAFVSLNRIFEIFNFEQELSNGQNLIKIESISFQDVTFNYPTNNKTILNHFNLNITNEHNKIGIIGPSGIGKTTIAKLLLKMYDCYEGDILINNISIKNISSASLRNIVSFVEQEPILLNDTIYENISIGFSKEQLANESKSNQEKMITRALNQSMCHFVFDLPDGIQTKLTNSGGHFSIGQKQRLAIARALVRNPKLLILDEPTASLDRENEAMIYQSLLNLPHNVKVLIISHKLNFINHCDLTIKL